MIVTFPSHPAFADEILAAVAAVVAEIAGANLKPRGGRKVIAIDRVSD